MVLHLTVDQEDAGSNPVGSANSGPLVDGLTFLPVTEKNRVRVPDGPPNINTCMKLLQLLNEAKASRVKLPRGKKVILEAAESDYKRGLIVELKEGGGYDVEYWYEDPSNITPAEVKIDGKSIKKDAKKVYLGFHPEKGDKDED